MTSPQKPAAPATPLSSLLFGWTRQVWIQPLLFSILIASAVALAVLGSRIDRHPKFSIEQLPAFYAVFGFLAFSVLVLSGWISGKLLKRPENYYREHDGQ